MTKADVSVVSGEVEVMLDFGTDPFKGNDLQLEIAACVQPASVDPQYATFGHADGGAARVFRTRPWQQRLK